jgi:hypothetical protein
MQGMRIRAVAALACGIAFLMLGCSDGASVTDSLDYAKGVPGPPDDKGGEEGASNNLGFPVIWSDGAAPTDFQELTTGWTFATVTDPLTECVGEDGTQLVDGAVPDEFLCYYGRKNTGLDEATGIPTLVGDPTTWWLQERTENRWQVFHMGATQPFVVTAVDFGDLLESASLNMKQVRTEVGLFLDANTNSEFSPYVAFGGACTLDPTTPNNCFAAHSMSGAVPGTDQSINEVQGTEYPGTLVMLDPTTVKSAVTLEGVSVDVHATVYPRCSRLLIQRLTGVPVWNPSSGTWSGADPAAVDIAAYTGAYTAEINAGGSMIFGYNWKTKVEPPGTYRLTFVIDGPSKCAVSNTVFDATTALVNEGNLNHGHLMTQADLLALGGDEGGIAYLDVYVGK